MLKTLVGLTILLMSLSSLAAKGLEGHWKGQGVVENITLQFLPNERWVSSDPRLKGGIYVIRGSVIVIDNFENQRVNATLSGDRLTLPVKVSNTQKVDLIFTRGDSLDSLDASKANLGIREASEMFLSMSPCRTLIHEYITYFGEFKPANRWGCEGPNAFGTIQTSAAGKITIIANRKVGNPLIDGRVITLVPMVDGKPARVSTSKQNIAEWRCGSEADLEPGQLMVDAAYRIKSCGGKR